MNDNERISEELKNYFKNLSDAKKTPTSKEFPFDLISKRISFIEMFCNIINRHPEELEASYKKAWEENKFSPSATLSDYYILNIAMFYECAKRRFKLENAKLPPTYKEVKRFRNKVMAHFDKQIKNNAQLVKEYIIINEKDGKGFERIYNEYKSFRDKIFLKIKNETTNKV